MPSPVLTTIKEITLNLDRPNDLVHVPMKQYDALCRKIKINLLFNDTPWPLPNVNLLTGIVRYKKPDGTKGMYNVDEDNNPAIEWTTGATYLTIRLAEQILVVRGRIQTEISIYSSAGEKLTTFAFCIDVEESSVSDAEYVSEDYYNVMRQLIAAFSDATYEAASSAALTIDPSLTIPGAIAEASVVGEYIGTATDGVKKTLLKRPTLFINSGTLATNQSLSTRTICLTGKPNTLYRITKAIQTTIRAGCASASDLTSGTLRQYTETSDSMTGLIVETDSVNYYIYVQLFINSDSNQDLDHNIASINIEELIEDKVLYEMMKEQYSRTVHANTNIINGNVDPLTSNNITTNNYARTGYLAVNKNRFVSLSNNDYYYRIVFSSANTANHVIRSTPWYTGLTKTRLSPIEASYIKVAFCKDPTDPSQISSSELSDIYSSLCFYDFFVVDNTFLLPGQAADAKLTGNYIFSNKDRDSNEAAALTHWYPAIDGWSSSSNPKMAPLDIPTNCYFFAKGDILDATDGIWFSELDADSYYTIFCYTVSNSEQYDIRLFYVYPSRSNKIYHGVKSASDNFVTWSKDYCDIDTTFSNSGQAADSSSVGNMFYNGLYASPIKVTRNDHSDSGVTFTWTGDQCYVICPTTVPSGGRKNDLISKQNLPETVRPGDRIHIEYTTTDPNVRLRLTTYDSNDVATYVFITEDQDFTIPLDAVQWAVWIGCKAGSNISQGVTVSRSNIYSLKNFDNTSKTKLRVLFIGNSYTHDCAEYFPFLLENIVPDIDLTCGIASYGGASIDQYIDWFDNASEVLGYSKYVSRPTGWSIVTAYNTQTSMSLQEILSDQPWDVITIQQSSPLQGDWSSFSDVQGLIERYANYIRVIHQKSVKIGYLMPQLRYTPDTINPDSQAEDKHYPVSYAEQQSCIQNLWENSSIEFIIPCGTSIENARTNATLNALGLKGHLVRDDTGHLHQGVPELIPTYVCVLKFAEMFGKICSVMGDPIRPTDSQIDIWNVPGYTTSSEHAAGVNDSNCILAAKCAIAAIKNPYQITTITDSGYTP